MEKGRDNWKSKQSPRETEREGDIQAEGLALDWSMHNLSTTAGGKSRYRWAHLAPTYGSTLWIASVFLSQR